jgi:hypothetical protein
VKFPIPRRIVGLIDSGRNIVPQLRVLGIELSDLYKVSKKSYSTIRSLLTNARKLNALQLAALGQCVESEGLFAPERQLKRMLSSLSSNCLPLLQLRRLRLSQLALKMGGLDEALCATIDLRSLQKLELHSCRGIGHFLRRLSQDMSQELSNSKLASVDIRLLSYSVSDLAGTETFLNCANHLEHIVVYTGDQMLNQDCITRHGKSLKSLFLSNTENKNIQMHRYWYPSEYIAAIIDTCHELEELAIALPTHSSAGTPAPLHSTQLIVFGASLEFPPFRSLLEALASLPKLNKLRLFSMSTLDV